MKCTLAFVALLAAVIAQMPSDAYAQNLSCYRKVGKSCVGPGYKSGYMDSHCMVRCFSFTNFVRKPRAKAYKHRRPPRSGGQWRLRHNTAFF
jgi:hypothetical protein